MIKAECLVWATIVQLFSFVRIDVIHHQIHIFLHEVVKTAVATINIREDSPYQFVVNLDRAFLIWLSCIAIKDLCADFSCSPVTFDCHGIREFTSIVRYDQWKDVFEQLYSKPLLQVIEYIYD